MKYLSFSIAFKSKKSKELMAIKGSWEIYAAYNNKYRIWFSLSGAKLWIHIAAYNHVYNSYALRLRIKFYVDFISFFIYLKWRIVNYIDIKLIY